MEPLYRGNRHGTGLMSFFVHTYLLELVKGKTMSIEVIGIIVGAALALKSEIKFVIVWIYKRFKKSTKDKRLEESIPEEKKQESANDSPPEIPTVTAEVSVQVEEPKKVEPEPMAAQSSQEDNLPEPEQPVVEAIKEYHFLVARREHGIGQPCGYMVAITKTRQNPKADYYCTKLVRLILKAGFTDFSVLPVQVLSGDYGRLEFTDEEWAHQVVLYGSEEPENDVKKISQAIEFADKKTFAFAIEGSIEAHSQKFLWDFRVQEPEVKATPKEPSDILEADIDISGIAIAIVQGLSRALSENELNAITKNIGLNNPGAVVQHGGTFNIASSLLDACGRNHLVPKLVISALEIAPQSGELKALHKEVQRRAKKKLS